MLWILIAGGLLAQDFVGSKSCVPCHAEQSRRHAASFHERALRPAAGSRFADLMDRPVVERSGVELHYSKSETGFQVEVRRDADSRTATLDWIFGAGMLAFTPVGQRDGAYFEHRVSWYSNLQRPGMTMGHPIAKPATATAALGQAQTAGTIFRCFNCHATNVRPGPDLSGMQAGIQCERCHGAAGNHVQAPSRRNIRRDASVEACAECHRMPDPKALDRLRPEVSDPMSIRFAPVGLTASKCFAASGKMSCTTCHDPHGRPQAEKPAYEKKCQGCHALAPVASSACPRVENTNCLSCHMRKATPLPGLTFTDHRIRIYPAGARN